MRHVRRGLPGASARASRRPRRSTCAPRRRCWSRAREHRFLRDPAGERSRARRFRQRARRAVSGAAVRILRRLRRLRRDALSASCCRNCSATALQIANATGCSSIYGGNLPVTPWTKNKRGARAGLVEFAVRGQCRIRSGLPPGGRQASGDWPSALARQLAPKLGDGAGRGDSRRAADRASRRSAPSAPGSPN